MRNNPMKTAFWRGAYERLSPAAQSRYAFHIKAAERWELRLDSAIELWSRAKALTRSVQAPRRSPSH